MAHIRTAVLDAAPHDPAFEVMEVQGSPGTLRVGSAETGFALVKIIGFPLPELAVRLAALVRLSELPIRSPSPRSLPASAATTADGAPESPPERGTLIRLDNGSPTYPRDTLRN